MVRYRISYTIAGELLRIRRLSDGDWDLINMAMAKYYSMEGLHVCLLVRKANHPDASKQHKGDG